MYAFYVLFYFSANGNLYGEYGIVNASLSASSQGGPTARTLAYTLVRREANLIGSDIVIEHSYSQVCYIVSYWYIH